MAPIQPADPGARRRALLLVVLAAFAGAALILLFEQHRETLQQWLRTHPGALYHYRREVTAVLALLLLPLWGFCFYLWRFAGRAIRDRRMPPLGVRAIRPTSIHTGQEALRRARWLRALALLLALSCAGLVLALWQLLGLLGDRL